MESPRFFAWAGIPSSKILTKYFAAPLPLSRPATRTRVICFRWAWRGRNRWGRAVHTGALLMNNRLLTRAATYRPNLFGGSLVRLISPTCLRDTQESCHAKRRDDHDQKHALVIMS